MRKIIHVDMDAFYASVECRDRPRLRGLPVAVGGSPEGRGVIATSNYEARKFGVRSAMSSRTAVRLCPQLILVRPQFSKYRAESMKIRAIFGRFSELIEPLSLDEAYLDVSESPRLREFQQSATAIAREIQRLIFVETGLTASAGVAPNKFLAKIASEMHKPNGLTVIRPEQIEKLMQTLPIEKIWGVGKVGAAKMHALGLHTCGDLQKLKLPELNRHFGSWGEKLYRYSRGQDERPVRTDRVRKSLSVEQTYSVDLRGWDEISRKVGGLFEDWDSRAVKAGLNAPSSPIRGLSVKLKYTDFDAATGDRVFSGYPNEGDFRQLLKGVFERRPEPVRLIGIGVRLAMREDKPTLKAKQQLAFDVG